MAFQAVAAFAAGDVAFAGNNVANLEALYARTNLDDLADILVTGSLANSDGVLCPLVPLIDVNVGAADGGFVNFDLDVVGANFRDVYSLEGKSRSCLFFYKSPHFVVVHCNLPFYISLLDTALRRKAFRFCPPENGYVSSYRAHSCSVVLVTNTY